MKRENRMCEISLPERGAASTQAASRWEEAFVTGNGLTTIDLEKGQAVDSRDYLVA